MVIAFRFGIFAKNHFLKSGGHERYQYEYVTTDPGAASLGITMLTGFPAGDIVFTVVPGATPSGTVNYKYKTMAFIRQNHDTKASQLCSPVRDVWSVAVGVVLAAWY